jgi:spermidine/putrescine-binding protein
MTEDGFGQLMIWNAALGHDDPTRVTIADLNDTTDFLIDLKQNYAVSYVSAMTDVARVLSNGTAWVSTIGWESTPFYAQGGADLRTTHPRPGDYSYCDCLAVAEGAPNLDLAIAFIDYLLGADAQARLINTLARGTVNADAVASLRPEIAALHSYADLDAEFALSPLRLFPPLEDQGDGIATYVDWVKSWERVRFTQIKS